MSLITLILYKIKLFSIYKRQPDGTIVLRNEKQN